ncbi:hypothetical protein [Actinomadura opuntiae]|uniref:hypothetical protein n=1 Tax=Actinomadura sp. OS1-43 TaxID=604315 RepID=UPI00255ACF31|nr:hypothetical protein [Actinomadura sp. OS1-43]MDL4816974.1 hypothetical protein [Actinomadura sp. OS1-43]
MIEMQGRVPLRADEEFAELICADDQWVREEFDALIAANYGAPPARPGPPAPPQNPPTGRPWRYPEAARGAPSGDPAGAGTRGTTLRRQRSPPLLRAVHADRARRGRPRGRRKGGRQSEQESRSVSEHLLGRRAFPAPAGLSRRFIVRASQRAIRAVGAFR